MITDINFKPGDVVRVFEKVKESETDAGDVKKGEKIDQVKTRIQIFEGTVLGIRGRGENKSFTVRKLSEKVGVEKIWPVKSPNIEKVVVKSNPKKKIKRAKLYYLRKTNEDS